MLCHLASPRSEGLFSGAIAQSPVVADRPLGRARDTAARLAKRLGIEPTLDAWRSVSEDQILDASVELAEPIRFAPDPVAFARDGLEVASLPSDQWARHMAFGPVFDPQDAFLPESVMAATSRGAGFDVPLLIGCTRHEYTSLTDPMRSVWNAQSDARSVFTSVGFPRLGTWAMMREFSELGEDTTRLLGQLLTAALFHFPVVHIVRARQAARVASTCDIETGLTIPAKKAGTWVYEFAWQKPSTGLADHCADVPFVFNCLRDDDVERIFGTATPPRGLATAIQNDWVRFIRSGDPSFPAWREGERGRIYGAEGQYSVKSARPFKVELNMMRLMRER